MAQIIKSRVYPKKFVDEFIRTQSTLILTNSGQSNQNGTTQGFALGNPHLLSVGGNLRLSQEYSLFEINKLDYDMDKGLFSLSAGISFPNECVEITIYADLVDTLTENVVLSFSHKTKNFQKSLSYDLEQEIFVNRWVAEKFAVIVYAEWVTTPNSRKYAATFSYLFKDVKTPRQHSSKCQDCLEENTLIKMADGSTKSIKDIRVGDMVAGKDRCQLVENVWRGSVEKYVCIVTDKKENLPPLLTTLDHPILTTRGMKRAMSISLSDVLISEYGEITVTSITIEEKNINVCNLSFFEKDDCLAILAKGIYVGDFECQNKCI